MGDYCAISGQKVNFDKSTVHFRAGVGIRMKRRVLRELGMRKGAMPFRYPGVPIGMKRLPARAFNFILEKLTLKLSSWKARSLSSVGRITLLRADLHSIFLYLMSCAWCLDRLWRNLRGFTVWPLGSTSFFEALLWFKGTRGKSLIASHKAACK